MRKVLLAGLMFLLAGMLAAQQAMNNDSVVKMTRAGLSEDLIVSTINAFPGNYDTSAYGLIALKEAGVGEKAIAAIVLRASAGPGAVETNAPPGADSIRATMDMPSSPTNAPPGVDIPSSLINAPPGVDRLGVWYKDQNDGTWHEVNVETVDFAGGGALKGLVGARRDLSGRLPGKQSMLTLRRPAEFILYLPDGLLPGDYQLLRLRTGRKKREFRVTTGGFLNSSTGARRDMVRFASRRIAPQVYAVTLDANVAAGEYGFLPT